MVSSKTVRWDLNLKFRSKFNHGFTNHCYAILKALHGLKEKRTHKVRDFWDFWKWDFGAFENV